MMSGDLLGSMGWSIVFWVVVLTGLAALVAVIVVWELLGDSQHHGRSEDLPEQILKRRLAQGQITAEEYDQLRRQLSLP